jgi:hypothetical protein
MSPDSSPVLAGIHFPFSIFSLPSGSRQGQIYWPDPVHQPDTESCPQGGDKLKQKLPYVGVEG